jgi:hypothetical protein
VRAAGDAQGGGCGGRRAQAGFRLSLMMRSRFSGASAAREGAECNTRTADAPVPPRRVHRPVAILIRGTSRPASSRPPAGANEFAAESSQSPPARTRRPGRARHPGPPRVRSRGRPAAPSRAAVPGSRGYSPRRRTIRPAGALPRQSESCFAPAKADFALFQRRIYSLLVRTGPVRPRSASRAPSRPQPVYPMIP